MSWSKTFAQILRYAIEKGTELCENIQKNYEQAEERLARRGLGTWDKEQLMQEYYRAGNSCERTIIKNELEAMGVTFQKQEDEDEYEDE